MFLFFKKAGSYPSNPYDLKHDMLSQSIFLHGNLFFLLYSRWTVVSTAPTEGRADAVPRPYVPPAL